MIYDTRKGTYVLKHRDDTIEIAYRATPRGVVLDPRAFLHRDNEPGEPIELEDYCPDWNLLADVRDRIQQQEEEA